VFLSNEDLRLLLYATQMNRDTFIDEFCREININGLKRLSLVEKPNYDCIFWENGGCTVYEYRPIQCRSYPFWQPFLESSDTWRDLEKSCPGVNHGPIHTKEEIDAWLKKRLENSLIRL
jgi:uncharacterized protein